MSDITVRPQAPVAVVVEPERQQHRIVLHNVQSVLADNASPDNQERIAALEQYCGAEAADRLAAAYRRLQNAGQPQP